MPFSFATVYTRDVARSVTFYTEVVGLAESRRFSPAPGMQIVFLSDGGHFHLELITAQGEKAAPGGGGQPLTLAFYATDIEERVEHLKQHGVPCRGPIVIPGGPTMVMFDDPSGVELMFSTATV